MHVYGLVELIAYMTRQLLLHVLFPFLSIFGKMAWPPITRAGSTAETVCLAGDSAGGNLCLSVALKAHDMGIREPDAIVPIYPALALMPDMPSPSRALSVMDPLISFGALVACLRVCVWAKITPGLLLIAIDVQRVLKGVCKWRSIASWVFFCRLTWARTNTRIRMCTLARGLRRMSSCERCLRSS